MTSITQLRQTTRRLSGAAVACFICLVVQPSCAQANHVPPLASGPRNAPSLPVYQDITDASFAFGVPADFIAAVIQQESGFHSLALSRKGAMGMMQLMPETAWQLGVHNPFDPRENIFAGTRYLSILIKRYKGNATLALAAYNAGEAAVGKYRGVPPYVETLKYIDNITYLYQTHRLSELQHVATRISISPRPSPHPRHHSTIPLDSEALEVPPLPSSIAKSTRTNE